MLVDSDREALPFRGNKARFNSKDLPRTLSTVCWLARSWHHLDGEHFGDNLDLQHRLNQVCRRYELEPYITANLEDHHGFEVDMLRQLEPCRWMDIWARQKPYFANSLRVIILATDSQLGCWARLAKARRIFDQLAAA